MGVAKAKPLTGSKKSKSTKKVNAPLFKMFGKPGTADVVECEPAVAPEGYLEIRTEAPTSFHILDNSGGWELPPDVNMKDVRQALYLKSWPIHKQLEAHQDAAQGDDTKLKELLKDFDSIKQQYPGV